MGRPRFLSHGHAYGAAGLSILDGIAQKIDQHLIEPQLITADLVIDHIHGSDGQFLILGLHVRLEDAPKPLKNLFQAAGLLFQVHLSAFDPAHVQHVVDQSQEVIA